MNAQPAGRETDGRMEGEKGKREDMGKTNAKGWKKRDEDGAGDGKKKKKSIACPVARHSNLSEQDSHKFSSKTKKVESPNVTLKLPPSWLYKDSGRLRPVLVSILVSLQTWLTHSNTGMLHLKMKQ